MNIRLAALEDISAIHFLNKDALHYDYPLKEAKQHLRYLLSSPTNRLFVAEIEEDVVGYVHAAEHISLYGPRLVNILALAIRSDVQRKGIGKALMEQAEHWANATGAAGIRLNSGESRTEAHRFYEHIGFKKIKNQTSFRKMFGDEGQRLSCADRK